VILVGLKKETREDLRAAGVDVVDSIEGAKVIGVALLGTPVLETILFFEVIILIFVLIRNYHE
jgi:hypothetical protein